MFAERRGRRSLHELLDKSEITVEVGAEVWQMG
jgi:hypothetical protein